MGLIQIYKRMELNVLPRSRMGSTIVDEIGCYSYVDYPATDQCLKLTETSTFREGTQNKL